MGRKRITHDLVTKHTNKHNVLVDWLGFGQCHVDLTQIVCWFQGFCIPPSFSLDLQVLGASSPRKKAEHKESSAMCSYAHIQGMSLTAHYQCKKHC